MDPHAQYEIRVFAEAMAMCAKAVAPIAYEAFEEHILGSVAFSRAEAQAMARLLEGRDAGLEGRALTAFEEKLSRVREAKGAEPTEDPTPPKQPSQT